MGRDKPPLPPELKRPLSPELKAPPANDLKRPMGPGRIRKMAVRSQPSFYDGNEQGLPHRQSTLTPEQEVARILSFEGPPKRNSVVNLPQAINEDQLRFRPISPPCGPAERPMSPLPGTADDLMIRFIPKPDDLMSQSKESLNIDISPKRGDQQRPPSVPADIAQSFSTFLGPFGPPKRPQSTDITELSNGRRLSPKRARSGRPMSPTMDSRQISCTPSSRPISQIGRPLSPTNRPLSPSSRPTSPSSRPTSPCKIFKPIVDTSRFVSYRNFQEEDDDHYQDYLQMKRKTPFEADVLVEPKWQVPEWSVDEVVMWVNKAGFQEYSTAFTESAVDGDILLSLTDTDIRDDIGIKNGIPRKRFLRELKNLKKNADYGCADDHGATANFLAKISPEFRAYTYNLVSHDLSYDYLQRLDPASLEDMLKYVGIESAIHRHKIVEAVINGSSEDEESMMEKLYLDSPDPSDIYISYPRQGGAELASLISMHMQVRGYSVASAPHDGNTVSEAVKNQVKESKYYIIIMPVGALDNCLNQEKCRLC